MPVLSEFEVHPLLFDRFPNQCLNRSTHQNPELDYFISRPSRGL